MEILRKNQFISFFLLLCTMLIVSGCSDPEFEKAENALKESTEEVSRLERSLQTRAVRVIPNLTYLKQYAEVVKQVDPVLKPIAATLEAEGSTSGAMFSLLKSRLTSAQRKFEIEASSSRDSSLYVAREAVAITQAAKPDVFNDSLVDVINVLADMSKGKLPKLAFGETADKSMPPTQHLVGNPAYGSWRHNGTGNNIWAWYGQYRLFSDVLGWGNNYRFNQDSWYRSRSGSYYGDVGRHYYGTDRNDKSWSQAAKRQPKFAANKTSAAKVKSFKSTGRLSNYAPRTRSAPKSMARTYNAKRTSSYANTRSAPSRSGGFSRRSGGK